VRASHSIADGPVAVLGKSASQGSTSLYRTVILMEVNVTIQEALQQGLDVIIFHRDTDVLATEVAKQMIAHGRTAHAFLETIGSLDSMQTVVAVLAVDRPAPTGTAVRVKQGRLAGKSMEQ
jgi:hypothetical protein